MRILSFLFTLLLVTLSGCGEPPTAESRERPLQAASPLLSPEELAGSHVRAVWVRSGEGTDWAAKGHDLVLMGYDSQDGEGERVLHSALGNYRKPLFSPDGSKVAFSQGDGSMIRLLDWEQGTVEELGPGTAVEFWTDPGSDRVYLYYAMGEETYRGDFESLGRFPINAPEEREIVYDAPVSGNNFDVSADGSYAVSLFPWPQAGILDLDSGEVEPFGKGCWTALAPNDSGKAWVFDGSHKWINLRVPGEPVRTVRLNEIPGAEGESVYYPRWSNHPRIIVLSAPFQRPDSSASDVYLGRFGPDFGKIEAWARISGGELGDFYPDVWIGKKLSSRAPENGVARKPGSMAATGSDFSPFQVTGTLLARTRTPNPDDLAPYRRALAAYLYRVESSSVPSVRPGDEIVVAHWVIEDGRVLRGFRREVSKTYELRLVPYEGNPDYEGERLVMDVQAGDRQLFVDVPD